MNCGSSNLSAENGIVLGAEPRFRDLGDLELDGSIEAFKRIEEAVASLLEKGAYVLALGGDHAISYPILRAYARFYRGLTILQLDAHPDLYDEYEGNRFSHACPFSRIMEEGLAARLVQVGIRTVNPPQRAQSERWGVEVIDMRHWTGGLPGQFEGPVYLSLDIDALDPAFAPGVSHPEPGGFSTREVIQILQGLRTPIVGADLVELNPERDLMDLTATAAGKLLKELASCMIESSSADRCESGPGSQTGKPKS
jgi:agmatinase